MKGWQILLNLMLAFSSLTVQNFAIILILCIGTAIKSEILLMNLDHYCQNNKSTSSIDIFTILLQILLREKVKKYVVGGA